MVSAGTTSIPLVQLFPACHHPLSRVTIGCNPPLLRHLWCASEVASVFLTKWFCLLHECCRLSSGKFYHAHAKLHHGRVSVWNRQGQGLGPGTGETHLIPQPSTCPQGRWWIALQIFCLGHFYWWLSRTEQTQLPSAAAVWHLPVVSKPTPSQTCPIRSPAVSFLPMCLYILSEALSRLLGFRQRTTDACFQAWGCWT